VGYSSNKRVASPPSRESKLLQLLKKAEIEAYALAHSYDVGGDLDLAWKLVSVGEYLREAASRLTEDAVHILEVQDSTPPWGLKSRALSLRSRVHGPAWANSRAASLAPRRRNPPLTAKKHRSRVRGRHEGHSESGR
jgi:hypothetical protein